MLQIHPSVPSLASSNARSQRPSEPEKPNVIPYNNVKHFNTITESVYNPDETPEPLHEHDDLPPHAVAGI